jgi:hypothetical protein
MGEPRMADSRCRWQCPEDWAEWSRRLAAGLHARNRWRLPVLLAGILFAHGRRTVTTWLRAAGVSPDFQDYYYFLAALGCKTDSVATQLLSLVLQTLPLPDRILAVIDDTPTKRYGPKVEGADIHHNPTPGPADQKYLYGHIWVTLSLGQTAKCTVYGKKVTKLYKTFLATYRPGGGVIRMVIVEEDHDWFPFFSTNPNATAVEIIEAFADRSTIEQDFHDVKEVWGACQQQVRNIWCNLAVYHLNLWIHTLVELWCWNRYHHELCDRSLSPWDDAERRPSHADRRKALRQHIMQTELSAITKTWSLPTKTLRLAQRLMTLAT